jgi:hypothetical protein
MKYSYLGAGPQLVFNYRSSWDEAGLCYPLRKNGGHLQRSCHHCFGEWGFYPCLEGLRFWVFCYLGYTVRSLRVLVGIHCEDNTVKRSFVRGESFNYPDEEWDRQSKIRAISEGSTKLRPQLELGYGATGRVSSPYESMAGCLQTSRRQQSRRFSSDPGGGVVVVSTLLASAAGR